MKSKKWLNVKPLYVLHIFLIAGLFLLVHYFGLRLGLERISNDFWWFVANVSWYATWIYLFDVTYHYLIGGD